MRAALAAAAFALCLSATDLWAQHALVLSGGGGRGLAHAGALVALEELGYDVPFVAGTSMGAIIGSLYAAGYDATVIRDIINNENWLERFSGVSVATGPDRAVHRPLLRFGLGTRRTPEGLLPATGVNRRLVELLFAPGARARNDFDRLPRRFRAITADLATGAELVIDAGDLPRAVRASMAVPGAFAPVRWQDTIFLIDGGVANNVPVSIARELTQLPVIAIDVLRPRPDIPERGALDVGVRGLRLLIENALPRDATDADILVLPRVAPGFSEAWFPADARPLVQAGYDAVLEQVPPTPLSPTRTALTQSNDPAGIASVRVGGGDAALRRLVERTLRPAIGDFSAQRVIERTSALYETGLFEFVWPRLDFAAGEDAPAALVVDVEPVNRTSALLSARWDSDDGGAALGSIRHLLSLHEPVELRGSARLGEVVRRASAEAAVFSVLLPGLAWTAGTHGTQHDVRLFADDTLLRTDALRRAGAWAGAELRRRWTASLLVRSDFIRDAGTAADGWATGPFMRFARVPAPGAISSADPFLEVESRFGDFSFGRFHARAGNEVRLGRARIAAFIDVADASRETPRDALPAATRELAPWLRTGEHRHYSRAAAALDVAVPLFLNGYARARLRAFAAGNDLLDLDAPQSWLGGGELGAIWPTIVGNVEVGAARGRSSGGWRVNVGVGPRF
jgi:predicted acylesterase/phospholipase RssA